MEEEQAVDGAPASTRSERSIATWIAWAALVLLAAVIPVLVESHVFPTGSPDRDDAGYLSQAAALRAGELTLPAETHDPFFLPFLSGVHEDRVVFKYQPAWPALIAASDAVTGSPVGALAVTGVASALAVAALAFELTQRRRAALSAGFVFVTAPWFVIQSGTYLAYPASTALLAGATALVLRGVRTGSGRLFVAAGAVMGLGVLHRPFDAVLGVVPLVVWYLVTRKRAGELRTAVPGDVGRIVLGAAPLALVFFAYNRAVTGKFLTLAFSLVGPNDTFGFGPRSSLADPGQPGFYDFTPGEAWRAALAFAASLPDWLPGGVLVLGAAYLGFRAVATRSLAWLVLAQGLIFPLGYFVWWGAANAWSYRLHLLLGPLYWFPLLATVAVLGGAGLDHLSTHPPEFLRRIPQVAIPVVAVVALLLVSAITSGDTIGDVRDARRVQNEMVAAMRPGPGDRTLTIAPPTFEGDIYVPVPVPPDLDEPHLVGMDPTGGEDRFDLLDRFPDRTVIDVFEIHEPGEPFTAGALVRQQLSVRSGETVTIPVRVFHPGEAYVEVDGVRRALAVDGDRGQVLLAGESMPGAAVIPEGEPVEVVIGVDDHELHYLARNVDGEVQVIVPPTPVRHYHFPGHDPVDVLEDVYAQITPA